MLKQVLSLLLAIFIAGLILLGLVYIDSEKRSNSSVETVSGQTYTNLQGNIKAS